MIAILQNNLFSPLFIEKIKLRLHKVFFLMAMWIIAGLFFAANQLLKDQSGVSKIFPGVEINSGVILIVILFTTAVVGIITGSFEAVMSEKRYHKLHVGKLILYNTGFYLALYFFMFLAGIYVYKQFLLPGGITIDEFENEALKYVTSPHALLSFIIFGVFVSFSLFLLHTREKFGSNILGNVLSGKYFYPREERRIFMFLDIKSATTIAEKLGALKYHKFLNDFYREITYPILYKKGEIYQYVGDEITISWSEKNGLKNSNCIECFFEIQNTIQNASQKFMEKYGVVPEFKAGLHMGTTVTGEIGIIKREIVYSGDTLNTAARIQSLCNSFGEKLLISDELLYNIEYCEKYRIKEIGEQELRGRKAKVLLYGIKKNNGKESSGNKLENKFACEITK
jgi:adenylate cyclase